MTEAEKLAISFTSYEGWEKDLYIVICLDDSADDDEYETAVDNLKAAFNG